MANPFYTIGHSTRTIPEFVDLLREAKVGLVVDVRTVPRSGRIRSSTGMPCPTALPTTRSGTSTLPSSADCAAGSVWQSHPPNGF
ncbi:hypothetical protein ILT44_21785 [Microvirga sp. BT689]|nr:hypothetical protein [Microvirga arvi]